MHDFRHARCFLEVPESKTKGLGQISRCKITFLHNCIFSLKSLLPLPSWFLPLQWVYCLWPLPHSGHIQTTPYEASIALKDACLLARA